MTEGRTGLAPHANKSAGQTAWAGAPLRVGGGLSLVLAPERVAAPPDHPVQPDSLASLVHDREGPSQQPPSRGAQLTSQEGAQLGLHSLLLSHHILLEEPNAVQCPMPLSALPPYAV